MRGEIAARALRCIACRRAVTGEGEALWLYPIPDISSDDAAGPATQATLPTDTDVAAHPRRVGRYVVTRTIGQGGMGSVFEVWDPDLERAVAMKVLHGGQFASAEARARFFGEARAAAMLEHPGIVRLLDLGAVDELPWFTMEKVLGPSLEEVLRQSGPLPLEEAARLVRAVAAAVHHAHEAGIAHRDLKPGNVLIDSDGNPKVADFGLAKPLHDDRELTGTHQVLGTPAYIAPEAALGGAKVDWVRVDVYGLGALLYATLTGCPPSEGSTNHRRLLAAARGERPAVRALRPEVPAALEGIVDRALQLDPAARYPDARAVGADLDRWLRGEEVSVRPEGLRGRLRRRALAHRSALLGGAAALGIVAAALAWSPLRAWQADRAHASAAERAWADAGRRLEAMTVPAERDTLRTAFAEAPEHRGTAAAARAWLSLGDEQRARRDHRPGRGTSDHLVSWSRALADAPGAALQTEALLRIARERYERMRVDDLGALLGELEAIAPPEAEAELLPLQLGWALLADQTDDAARLRLRAQELGLPVASRFADPVRTRAALGTGTPLRLTAQYAWFPHREASEEPEAWLLVGDRYTRATLTLPVQVHETLTLPGRPDIRRLRRQEDGTVTTVGPPWPRAWGDLDGDGVSEGYGWDGRDLLRADRTPAGLRWRPVDRGITLARSDGGGVVVADLDADGADELVAGLGAWHALDVRVLVPDGAGGLRLRARAHRNSVFDIAALPDPWQPGALVVALESECYPNARVHGHEHPAGPPSAVVVRRLVGDELVEIDRWELPKSADGLRLLRTVDVDGDGRQEVVGVLESDAYGSVVAEVMTFVLWPAAERDRFEVGIQWGVALMHDAELDGDPATELVVAEGSLDGLAEGVGTELWILGHGDTPLPRRPVRPPTPPQPAPEGVAGEAAERVWLAADLLARSGLRTEAVDLLERQAAISQERTAVALGRAAAALWAAERRPERAAAAWERVAMGDRAGPWADAALAWLDAGEPGLALRAAAAQRRLDPAAALPDAALAPWQEAAVLRVDGSTPLDPGWAIEVPLALEHRPTGVVLRHVGVRPPDVRRGTLTPRAAPLARLPLRRVGDALAMQLDATWTRAEWGSRGDLGLDLGAFDNAFAVAAGGGGELVSATFLCPGRLQGNDAYLMPDLDQPIDVPLRVRFRLAWLPHRARWMCSIELPELGLFDRVEWEDPPPPAELSLVLGNMGQLGAYSEAQVERLELWGVVAGPPVTERALLVQQALAAQAPTRALELAGAELPVARAIAQARTRQLSAAVAALREARGTLALQEALPYLLRAEPERFTPLLREALGPEFLGAFHRVWDTSMGAMVRAPWVRDTLWAELEGVELSDDPRDPAWELLGARALAMLSTTDAAQGREAALRWLAALDRLPTVSPTHAEIAARLHRLLAFAAASRGEIALAQQHAAWSMERSATPEIDIDRFLVAPAWRGLELPRVPERSADR